MIEEYARPEYDHETGECYVAWCTICCMEFTESELDTVQHTHPVPDVAGLDI